VWTRFISAATTCALVVGIGAQAPVMGAAQGDENQKSPYEIALAQAKKDPASADYGKLRELYSEDSSYSPYVHLTRGYRENHSALFEALEKGNYKEAIRHAEAILDIDYLDTESHFFIARAYESIGDTKRAAFHRQFFEGVMGSILGSGDGASPESAIKVVTLTEEWAVLSRLGYPPGGAQATEVHEGVKYDVLGGTHVETGEARSFYFRPVDAFWKKIP
jgi:hypothetical protein